MGELLDGVDAGLAAIGLERTITVVPEIDYAVVATERLGTAFAAIGAGGGRAAGAAEGSAGSAAGAAAAGPAGQAIAEAADQAATGWAAGGDELARCAEEDVNWGKGLGTVLSGACRSAEDALAGFVTARDTRQPVDVVMTITTPDANGFRQSRGRVAAHAARAIERVRRNL